MALTVQYLVLWVGRAVSCPGATGRGKQQNVRLVPDVRRFLRCGLAASIITEIRESFRATNTDDAFYRLKHCRPTVPSHIGAWRDRCEFFKDIRR